MSSGHGLYTKTLAKGLSDVLAAQADVVRAHGFYLAGGTALGLRLGHRSSRDLDWFTARAFDRHAVQTELASGSGDTLSPENFQPAGEFTLRAYYAGNLETSFIRYAQFEPDTTEESIAGVKIRMATLTHLAAMKAGALLQREEKRDYIDAYEICRQPGWSVGRFIDHACQTFGVPAPEFARALTYFGNLESQTTPARWRGKWKDVTRALEKGVQAWAS